MFKNESELYGPDLKDTQEITVFSDRFVDIARKWGYRFYHPNYQDKCVFLSSSFGVTPEISIFTSLNPINQNVIVSKGNETNSHINLEDYFHFQLPQRNIEKKTDSGIFLTQIIEEGNLLIDKHLIPLEVLKCLINVDLKAKERGLLDNAGNRISLQEYKFIVPQKLSVEKTFSDIGKLIPLMGKNPEEVMKDYDEPEKLFFVTDPYSGEPFAVSHVKNQIYFEKRAQILNDVLIEKGIYLEELLELQIKDPKTFLPLFDSISQEVIKRINELIKNQ